MVLSQTHNHEETSSRVFIGEGDVRKVMFYNEHVVMRGKLNEVKAVELLPNIDGDSFEIYFCTFAKDGEPEGGLHLSPGITSETRFAVLPYLSPLYDKEIYDLGWKAIPSYPAGTKLLSP